MVMGYTILNGAADSIYHDPGTGILFASFKHVGADYAGDMEKMRANPKVREWWAMTDGFQEVSFPCPSLFQKFVKYLRLGCVLRVAMLRKEYGPRCYEQRGWEPAVVERG